MNESEQPFPAFPEMLNMDTTAGPLWSRLASFGNSESLRNRFPRFVSCVPRLLDAVQQAFACALDVSASTDNTADIAVYGLGRLCLEDFTEIGFLVENDFDYAALKLLRGLYERVVVTETIIESPVEAARRFFDYYLVTERKWNRRAKTVYPGWDEDPSGLAESYEGLKDKFKYEPCPTCGKPPQQSWTAQGLDALAGELGKAGRDPELRIYGKELRHLYLFCAERTNPHIHASMSSIMERLSGKPKGQLDPGTYALCYAHLLLVVAIDAQNRRFALGMDALIEQLQADRAAAWLGAVSEDSGDEARPEETQADSDRNEESEEMGGFDLTFPKVPLTGKETPLSGLVVPDERITRYAMTVEGLQSPFFEFDKRLPKSAPKPLLDRIAVSRQLATYGYFCYEFHAVSMFWSVSCIEMALKLKFREVSPGPFRLVRKTKDGTEETTEVPITFLEKRLRERWRLPEMKDFDYSFRAFLAWSFRVGLLPDDLPIPVQEIINAFNNRFATEIFFDRALKEGLIGPNPTLGELQACWARLTDKQREHYSFKSSGVLVEQLPRFRNDLAHPESWNLVTVPRSAVTAYELLVDIVSRLWPVRCLVQVLPLVELPEDKSPAWPYDYKSKPEDTGFFAILSEPEAATAVEDQIAKLGPDFDRSQLAPFYRLLWLLNDTDRHKTFQGYLGVRQPENTEPGKVGFFSEVLLAAFEPTVCQFKIGLADVYGLLDDFQRRISDATAHSDEFTGCSVVLTPVRTIFGAKPSFQWGYSLSLKVTASKDSRADAVATWTNLLRLVNRAFEPVTGQT